MNVARILAAIFLILGPLALLERESSVWAMEQPDDSENILSPVEEAGSSPNHELSVPLTQSTTETPDDTFAEENASASISPGNTYKTKPVVSKLPVVRINLFAAERDFDLNGVLVNGTAIANRISQNLSTRLAQSGKFTVLRSSTSTTRDTSPKTQKLDSLPMESMATDDDVSRDTSMDGITENEFTLSPPEKDTNTLLSDGVSKPHHQQATVAEPKTEKTFPYNTYVLQGTVASVSSNEEPRVSTLTGGALKPARTKLVLNCEMQAADTGMTIWSFTMASDVATDSGEENNLLLQTLDSIGVEVALSMVESLNPARITDVDNGMVRLDAGSNLYAKNELLAVYEEQDGMADDTQELMPLLFGTPVGTITITGANKGKAIASYTESAPLAPGMICRRPEKAQFAKQNQNNNEGGVTILEGGGVKLPFDK